MLKELKFHFAHEIDFASRTTQLGLFDFRAFLNLGMLLLESEKAKEYKDLIKLEEKVNVRATMYAEVFRLIAI